ncbi:MULTISPECIES: IS66 family transposase [Rhizobium]|jgi:transposase|uniref:IS66 family transposase n=3 Tax=Rhizobium/Agrobacterium group TaxID=227290 RepID=A0A2A5KJD3_9HYPH|nr:MULTISPECIES: IS66 family transposase [Rhizobium]UWU38919.1 IS66 family transposase [Rhizobium leguminosarum bv. phaseoli]MBP2484402.1 transposase [Rhizobium leguminosarum]MDK4730932.1 IS66 family transposase [Rhizobium phaseoli]PCK77115.1 IS66 family transposase [Rhizobium sophoriradicis]PDT29165.1 IS66 family transposase [Rhizobium sp. M10]
METAPLDSQDELNTLRALVAEQAAKLESQEAEVIKRDSIIGLLRAQLELLRHRQHGASSEKIDRKIEQFELMLEEIEASRAEAEQRSGKAPCNCPTCGGTSFLKAADRVVQVLEHVPASVKIVRHVEKRMICRECDTTVAGEMPTLPIERGKPGPGLLAHIMIAKFDDHIPLYRLSEMYDRLGIDISRSVMADWVGRVSALLTPLVLLIRAHIAALDRIHTDDTPVDVLDPGRGKTKTGRVWVYVFDGSGYQSATPAAIAYYYSPDRRGAHPADHLASFSGVMHADGYGGYKKLYGNQIIEAACMAHVRRKFHDVIKLKPSPIAEEALSRIGALYDIENRIRGMSADERRTLRQHHARPVLDELKAWIEATLSTLPQKQRLAEAMRYALSRWAALSVYIDDGRVEIDNNIAERAMRPLGIGRKNWLFAGSDKGGERIANILTIIETVKLQGHNPEVYLTDVLTRIQDHPEDRIEDLLPWNWTPAKARCEAA